MSITILNLKFQGIIKALIKFKAIQEFALNVQALRRALVECGIGSFIKPKKPLLSQKNIKARLEWAKAHVDWTINDWKLAVRSDQTKIARFGSDGKRYCWTRESESVKPKHVQQMVKHGGGISNFGVALLTMESAM